MNRTPIDPHSARELNHAWWEERARLHPETLLYRRLIDPLRAGSHSLDALELGELQRAGGVDGLDVLHLQCHVGTSTLSLARLGARVTGVDFSPAALDVARALADEIGLDARFVLASVEELALSAEPVHDLVFTSWGTTPWLPDLDAWAAAIEGSLRPGGRFHVIDGHPMLTTIDDEAAREGRGLQLRYPYFGGGAPLRWEDTGSYADRDLPTEHDTAIEWPHSLSEIVSALLDRGLVLESFREHRAVPWQALRCCIESAPGTWRLPEELADRLPLAYSLRCRRP